MSENARQSSRPPVNLKGLQERVLLSASLMRLNAQLRNFTPLRERLVAHGQDANAAYRQIESRRDQVMAELKKLTPAPVLSVPPPTSFRPPRPVATLSPPIAPARFLPPRNSPWFGYSGTVYAGPLHEGDDIIPPGTTGSIGTGLIDDLGGVFNCYGGLSPAPPDGHPKEYFWLHSWIELIPFPAPVVHSTFTYSFPVYVGIEVYDASGAVTLWCFVSVGETADFVGQKVVVNTVDSWPLVIDVNESSFFPQSYQGQSNVQRSFVVEAGHVPAVAVALGIAAALESGAGVSFYDAFMYMGERTNVFGQGDIVNFRYDPTPPLIKTD